MEGEQAIVFCDSTKGPFQMRFYRDWSPHGYDRAVELYEKNFFDDSHFFRCVPGFLCQFGITYSSDPKLRDLMETEIPDDPQLNPPIKFEAGIMSYAGDSANSRTTQMFIVYAENEKLGTELWETPFGKVESGMENVGQFYSYRGMTAWGDGPVQDKIYDGPEYINTNFPRLDKFKTCTVKRVQTHDAEYVADVVPRGEKLVLSKKEEEEEMEEYEVEDVSEEEEMEEDSEDESEELQLEDTGEQLKARLKNIRSLDGSPQQQQQQRLVMGGKNGIVSAPTLLALLGVVGGLIVVAFVLKSFVKRTRKLSAKKN